MGCAGCVATKPKGQLRSRWARVERGGKRRVTVATTAIFGAAIGWRIGQGQGVLVGMFLAGSLGEILGLVRYSIPALERAGLGQGNVAGTGGPAERQGAIS